MSTTILSPPLTSTLHLTGASPSPASLSPQSVPTFSPQADGRFPVPDPCLSHWLEGVRGHPLLDHRTTEHLPTEADVVIIGSGMSGALVAYTLLRGPDPPDSVVILEARETCSGATGRNAGHCKPDQWRGFAKYEKRFGAEQAKRILDNEWETYSDLIDFVRTEGVECDLWVGDTVDVAMSPEIATAAQAAFERYKNAGGDVSRVTMETDPTVCAKTTRLKSACSTWAWPASTLYPWKLVAHLLTSSLPIGLNLQTHTAVTSVTPCSSSSSSPSQTLWSVNTKERGSIITPKVVHATNAFASTLLAMLDGKVKPNAFMCTKVTAPEGWTGEVSADHEVGKMRTSMGVLMPGGSLFSINPHAPSLLPSPATTILTNPSSAPRKDILLFGGDNPNFHYLTSLFASHPHLKSDDRITNFEPIQEAVTDFTSAEFSGWKAGEEQESSWSGVLGMSSDGVPWIGRVPGRGMEGQFVIAGHNGHGMARIFTAAPALARLMAHPEMEFKETGLPDVFEVTEARLAGLGGVGIGGVGGGGKQEKAKRGHGFG